MRAPRLLAVALAMLVPLAATAQQRTITLDDLYDPQKRVTLGGFATGVTWLDDTTYLRVKGSGPDAAWVRVDAATGTATPFIDTAKLEGALAALPGVSANEAQRLARRTNPLVDGPQADSPLTSSEPPVSAFDPARAGMMLRIGDDLYHYTFASGRLVRLTNGAGDEQDPAFSPDGRLVAFTRGGNLFVVDVATQRERQLTTDGSAAILNGRLDWVYQEEVYGRGSFRAFWWSPDSTRLAFLRLDEHPVPEFTLVDHIPHRQSLEVFDYPKAGDPNPTVTLHVVRAIGGPARRIDTSKYSAGEHLIVNVSWNPAGTEVVYALQDREQTWLDLNYGNAVTGATRTLFRETTKAWVDPQGDPTWLADGSFLWTSERTGWKHLYHYKAHGEVVRQVTSGPWEVRTLYGVDEARGLVYFAGTERSHIGGDLYRIGLDGTGLRRLSQTAGTHRATFNPGFTHYVGVWTDVTTPAQSRLHRADGTEVRVIDGNKVEALAQFRLGTPEFLQVKARDGFVMEAMMIKPPDFDPKKKYPVFQQAYAGPHAQTVRNGFGGTGYLFNQMLAQHGIIVWMCDNRSASGKGAESAWAAYRQLGVSELADIEDCLAYLKKQPWVDDTRIGINGWSYGGFMVSYALTHSTSFAMGIAGGSVEDWALYDSIYTERFMRMPQHNPEGYAKSSNIAAARNLSGRLLLLHGAIDDNVHMQNTIQFAYALQKAGKPFEMMIYPKSRHGVSDPALVKHMQTLIVDFIMRTLTPGGARAAGPGSQPTAKR